MYPKQEGKERRCVHRISAACIVLGGSLVTIGLVPICGFRRRRLRPESGSYGFPARTELPSLPAGSHVEPGTNSTWGSEGGVRIVDTAKTLGGGDHQPVAGAWQFKYSGS